MAAEYEVETILKAKVFMKGKKMGWKFYVKWKGYQDTDNTWEPFKSFESCGEEIVGRFWDRVDTKGRDVNSIEGWTNGEEVYPIGPPRRKSRMTPRNDESTNSRSPADEHPSPRGAMNGRKAKRPSEPLESQRSSKRKRASSSRRKSDTQASRRTRAESRSPVPDSQSEDELLMVTSPKEAVADMLDDIDASNLVDQVDHKNAVTSSFQGQAEEPEHYDRPSRVSDHVTSQNSTQTMVEDVDFSVASGSQPVADPSHELVAPQTRRTNNVERGLKGRKASLLAFSKKTGALETLKRKRVAKDNNEEIGDAEEVLERLESTSAALASAVLRSGSLSVETPPQGNDGIATEQMKFASQDDTESHPLPDYEEQSQPCPSSPKIELPDKMPTSISFPEPSSGRSSPWKRATIFGPLAIGAGSPSWATSWGTPDMGGLLPSIPKPFVLRLDNSISLPVALKDVSAQAIHHLHLESIVSGTTDPPGKLYTSHAATALLETLEIGGSCARLVPGDTATPEHRRVFDAFATKLGEGGLFVVMASSEVLACCSSTNENYTKKLALATALRGLSETVVVSHVKVVNYSAFADAAAQAESVRW